MPVSSDQTCLTIVSSTGDYRIRIGDGLLTSLQHQGGDCIFVVDDFFAPRFAGTGLDPIVVHADEHAKSLERMPALIEAIKARGGTRKTTLVAVGGGVVQDCVTFAASVFMRGMPWIYVPTTLLSMADSCIGGKSSVNVGSHKNIVGTFHPPLEVLIDPLLVESLDTEQRIAGLCEAIKICMCRGGETLSAYRAHSITPASGAGAFAAIIALCLQAKKWFIEIDEFDRKERLVLNFGHTFGHAIETASGFAISHGVAVGLGMLAALDLGRQLGHTDPCDPGVRAFADDVRALVAGVDGLPAMTAGLDLDVLMRAFGADKKHSRDEFAVIMIGQSGAVSRFVLPRDDRTASAIRAAFKSIAEQVA